LHLNQGGGFTIDTNITAPRVERVVARVPIDKNALIVINRLNQAGYEGYLVGGCVRDMLLGREPKDFDVVTDAYPEQVKSVFNNCRLIGRRFRLAHVWFGRDIIEVATFRARHSGAGEWADVENRPRDNVYGTQEEDAWRRDFTVNALYYDVGQSAVIDYVGGLDDLKAGLLRLIGDPETRYREDPVRMLRVVRFAAKLGFRIHPDSEAPLFTLGPLLEHIPPARLFEETLKLFMGGCALATFEMLRHYGLFGHLFPQTEACLSREEQGFPLMLLHHALRNTDLRISEDKPVTPGFLLAALLWEPMRRMSDELMTQGMSELQAIQAAGAEVVSQQTRRVSMPRRFSQMTREVWQLQPRLQRRTGRQPFRLIQHPRFRAAYDFLLLRGEAGEDVQELGQWWTQFQQVDDAGKTAMMGGLPGKKRRSRSGARRRRQRTANPPAPGPDQKP
jgi:poly(A) polymerase